MNLIKLVLSRLKEYTELGLNPLLIDAGLSTVSVFRNAPVVPRKDTRMIGIVTSPEEGAITYEQGFISFKITIDLVLSQEDDIETDELETKLYDYADVLFTFYEGRIFEHGETRVMSLAVFHQFNGTPPEIVLELLVAKDYIC